MDTDDDPRTARFYPREGAGAGFDRLIFFSDAVFAIALTLVAVEIGVPEIEDAGSNQEMWDGVLAKLPAFGAYIVAFLWVAFYWRANHRFTATLRGASGRYILMVLLYLGFVAMLPFFASMLGQYGGNAVAVSFFAAFAAVVSAVEVLMFVVADRDELFLKPISADYRRKAILGGLTPVPVFLLSIPLAFVSTALAIAFWVVGSVALGWSVNRFTGDDADQPEKVA
jgi:uncharacterized membrane protein